MVATVAVEPHLFIIFGGTGDLTRRKLLKSLWRVMSENESTEKTTVLAVGLETMTDEEYRAWARQALMDAGLGSPQLESWCEDKVFYHGLDREAPTLTALHTRIRDLESRLGLPGNRAFYLALPPVAVPGVIEQLGAVGLNRSPGWTRIVFEKPFGRDLESAVELNAIVHRHFDETQVYRIDHYLGKETVQNLLAFRFANPLFESTWNRDRVEAVEITVAESLGVGTRAGYYEQAGALRDMVQNHLTQLMTLVAMEAPSSFRADAIRNEKVQVLESVRKIDPDDIVYGQYIAGAVEDTIVPGYRDEPGVDPDSRTPTFVGLKLFIDNWRWEGIPFFLRTGKRLPRRTTQIAVKYRKPPVCLFHGDEDECVHNDVILLTLQPDEGVSLRFDVKVPGEMRLASQPLSFRYAEAFAEVPDAYQTLILDIIQGDQTLFVRNDEVEASWRLYTPILELDLPVHPYAAGTWGPASTNTALALGTPEWTMRH